MWDTSADALKQTKKSRSVVCSTFRFVSIIEHKATTYPTFDPTWYGPTAIVLSILEVDIATIMASLPVFWPFLRRNIDRILITHEIEVKVTEHFTQIDDTSGSPEIGRRSRENGYSSASAGAGAAAAASSSASSSYTPWMDGNEANGKNWPVGLKLDHKIAGHVVMMRDLGRTGSGTTSSEAGESDLPFDGSRGPDPRSQARPHYLNRDSKEGLLNR